MESPLCSPYLCRSQEAGGSATEHEQEYLLVACILPRVILSLLELLECPSGHY